MDAAFPQLSPEMEDYLEAIAALTDSVGEARVTDIAARLSVRKPSVTQALRSLAEKGLLKYKPYVSPTLTERGQRLAERVQRRHRVMKRFLTEVLLIGDDVAEANACRMEHAIDKEVLEHLVHFMDFVHRCPRGGAKWIRGYEYYCEPDTDVEKCERCMTLALDDYREKYNRHAMETDMEQTQTTTDLAQLRPGQTAQIVRVGNSGPIRRRLVDMGAVRGTPVEVVKVAPLGDPLEVKIKGYSLTLRKEEAAAITVTREARNG